MELYYYVEEEDKIVSVINDYEGYDIFLFFYKEGYVEYYDLVVV